MNYYTKYFVVNLVIEGSSHIDCFSHFSCQKNKQVITRLSYIIIEAKENLFNTGRYCYYTYTGICFKGHIKKLLSAKNVCRLTSTCRSHINFSRYEPKSLTNEEILSMVKDDIFATLIKQNLYSYIIYDKERINFKQVN